ncbi:MAG: hypothetical protein RUMPE_00786 [Eubacteriales bacterium SKADARSKE-1]|nr:hypothetical protein [Eubacteriales bacterium SKADARSKE-1]
MAQEILTSKKLLSLEKRKKLNLPIYSTLEEVLNAVTHGIGALLSIAAIVLLIVFSDFNPKTIACVTIYSATLFLLYIVSTLYHALAINKAKTVFRVLDHCSIFILILGTYTPVCLLMLNSTVGWVLFSTVLLAAIVGIVFNSIDLKKYSKFSMICYLAMSWVVIFAIKPLLMSVSSKQLIFFFLGGVAYTIGAVIYKIGKKVKYMHSVWHLFVLAGSILHFFMIFDFIKAH